MTPAETSRQLTAACDQKAHSQPSIADVALVTVAPAVSATTPGTFDLGPKRHRFVRSFCIRQLL